MKKLTLAALILSFAVIGCTKKEEAAAPVAAPAAEGSVAAPAADATAPAAAPTEEKKEEHK